MDGGYKEMPNILSSGYSSLSNHQQEEMFRERKSEIQMPASPVSSLFLGLDR
jgi:hypothetical protein